MLGKQLLPRITLFDKTLNAIHFLATPKKCAKKKKKQQQIYLHTCQTNYLPKLLIDLQRIKTNVQSQNFSFFLKKLMENRKKLNFPSCHKVFFNLFYCKQNNIYLQFPFFCGINPTLTKL